MGLEWIFGEVQFLIESGGSLQKFVDPESGVALIKP
jgi:hypothetical protein